LAGEYEHIKGKGNRFSSTNQPQNRGRKPKLYTIAKKAYGLSYEEYKEMRMYLMQLSKKELEELAKDESTPMWVVILCRAYIKGAAKGDARSLEETKADLWIKDIAATKIDVTTNGKDIGQQIVFSPTPLSEKDIQEIKDIQNGNKEDSNDTGISET
jgi:hypothetical protein